MQAVDEVCEELAQRGQFIVAQGLAEWVDGTVSGQYGFRHVLYHDVLRQRLGAGRRARAHLTIGIREEEGYGARANEQRNWRSILPKDATFRGQCSIYCRPA